MATQARHDHQADIAADARRDERGRWLPGTSGNPASGPLGNKSKVRRALDKAVEQIAGELVGASAEVLGGAEGLFEGGGLDLLRAVYRNPAYPLALRIEAATRALRAERPTLTATVEAQPPNGTRLTALIMPFTKRVF